MERSDTREEARPFSGRAAAWVAAALLAAALAAGSVGCVTPNDSDMPWNAPQSWEGSPTIPGFNQ